MSDVVDRISDHDDAETARKRRRVGAKNEVVFESLFKALEERVSEYNERHPRSEEAHV